MVEDRISRQHFSELPSATYSVLTGRVDRLIGYVRHTLPGRFVVASELRSRVSGPRAVRDLLVLRSRDLAEVVAESSDPRPCP